MPKGSARAHFVVWGANLTPHGPMELPALVSWVKENRISAGTWIFDLRGGEWRRALDLPELQLFFQARPRRSATKAESASTIHGIDIRVLRQLRLLANMTDQQLERLAPFIELQSSPQGATVVKQGDIGDGMYVILEGEFRVSMNVGGQQANLASLGPGDFFGDIALLDRGPRTADVVTAISGSLLRISVTAFERLSREMPDLATPFLRAIGKTLTARLRTGNKHQREFFKISRALEI